MTGVNLFLVGFLWSTSSETKKQLEGKLALMLKVSPFVSTGASPQLPAQQNTSPPLGLCLLPSAQQGSVSAEECPGHLFPSADLRT